MSQMSHKMNVNYIENEHYLYTHTNNYNLMYQSYLQPNSYPNYI